MTSPVNKSKEDVDTIKREILGLVEWLRTFPQFTGHSNLKEARSERDLLEALDDEALVNSILSIAEEICGWTTPNGLRTSGSSPGSWDPLVLLAESEFPHFFPTREKCTTLVDRVHLLSTLLGRAVSETCHHQARYVGTIMRMDLSAQQVLKSMIEKDCARQQQHQKQSFTGSRRSRDEAFGSPALDTSDCTPVSKRHAHSGNTTGGQEMFSPDTVDSSGMAETVKKLREENADFQKQLQGFEQRELDLYEKIQEMEAKHRKDMMKVESASMRKEAEVREDLENEICTLKAKVEELTAFNQKETSAQAELEALQDEVDVLQHTKAKLVETEGKLRNYQERLEQAADVKEALKREEEAHGASVEECLRLTNELQVLQPLKRQLEDYKIRATDAEVKLADCQDELKRMERMSQTLNSTRKELLEGARIQQEEVEELRMRLCKEEEDDGLGVGEGISELNPAIREEVLRLRNENAHLKAFAAKRGDDAVQKLEEELDDKKRLSNRFKEQFLETKSALEETQNALTQSKEQEKQLKAEVTEWTEKTEAAQKLASRLQEQLDSTIADLEATRVSLSDAQMRITELKKEVEDWTEKANLAETTSEELNELLTSTETKLEEAEQDLRASLGREEDLIQEVKDWTEKAHDAEKTSFQNGEQLANTKVALAETQEALAESKDRETFLKANIDDLTGTKQNLEKKLEEELCRGQEAMLAADRTLKETVIRLSDEARMDKEELEISMNHVLENERQTFKKELLKKKDEFKRLEISSSKELNDLRQTSSQELQASEEQARRMMDKMKKDHAEELELARKKAEEEQDAIIRKGRTMLKETKSKAEETRRELELEIKELNETVTKMKAEQEDLVQKSRDKIANYKRKLNFTTVRVDKLSKETDELQDTIRVKEREVFTLREENDRFRRQLGGRFGADGKVQSQLEMLQKEFDAVFEECKKLKKMVKNAGTSSNVLSPFNQNSSLSDGQSGSSYSGGNVTRTAMGQLREEYEETIQELIDEKRELVMKNSAAIADVRKAEQRAWETDMEVAKLKEELTSVKLLLQRAERSSELNLSFPDMSQDDETVQIENKENHACSGSPTEGGKHLGLSVSSPALALLSPNRSRSTPSAKVQKKTPLQGKSPQLLLPNVYDIDANEVKGRASSGRPSNDETKQIPTLMEYTTVNGASAPEGQQECQQS